LGADDYITKPFDIEELKLRVKNAIDSSRRTQNLHPVTGLPTGRLIEEHLRLLMHGTRQWAYLDMKINHWEPFKEVYGYLAGDEVLRFIALLMNEVMEEAGTNEDFLGHPGSDNFVIITHASDVNRLKSRLTERFNEEVKQHYSFIDRERGYILVPDSSRGERQEELMTLAVGAVSTQTHQFSDIREITELAADDRRRGSTGEDAGPSILTSW
jgi:GGDEF domain-containing protein